MKSPALLLVVLCCATTPALLAQAPSSPNQPAPQPSPAPSSASSQPARPQGQVLFSRSDDDTSDSASQSGQSATPTEPSPSPDQPDPLHVTDAERKALNFTGYDLDLHLAPATSAISARAALTVRNDGSEPLHRLVLDITSTAQWQAISSNGVALKFVSRLLDTDADHTGQMQEAVVTLPSPLAPGKSISVTALYAGIIEQSATRLERIGAPSQQAISEDWDEIASQGTYLRGFGNVLWYPVSASPVFLGDGAQLFQEVGEAKLRESSATMRLRLAVEYAGDPPDAAFFCGRREQLTAISDDPNIPIAEGRGIATANFAPRPLGFRIPDLFVTSHPASTAGTTENPDLLSVVTDNMDALPTYKAAAALVQPLLTSWFGATPQSDLTILDHSGKPYEDGTLLVRPMRTGDAAALAPSLVHSLTHAWIHSSHPWIEEGLAQFMSLLWLERTSGRAAALNQLQDADRALALIEPELPAEANTSPDFASTVAAPQADTSSGSSSSSSSSTLSPSYSTAGRSLTDASGEVFYRTKAAAVWWMLRDIVGDEDLQHAIQKYFSDSRLDHDPQGLEHVIEDVSHKDIRWFFHDWVYNDMGLPDLTVVNVTPSQLGSHGGVSSGWLVAVDVRNDGYAQAEVPVTVRSATAKQTQMLRIPGRSSASIRIVFASQPDEVQVNDGSVPETRTSIHTRKLVLPGQ